MMNQQNRNKNKEVVLEARHVTRTFEKGRFTAVSDLSFRLRKGHITGLIGVNGAGKTTTIKMCATLLNPSSGQVLVHGIDTVTNPAAARECIGLMLGGSSGFYPRTSVRDNLLFFADIANVPARERKSEVDRVLAEVELTDLAGKKAYELSRGQYQRLHIARSLLGSPDILLLDEPTSGLDPDVALRIRSLIRSIALKGTAVLLTSHSMEEVEELADSFIVINHGRMKVAGQLADVAAYAHLSWTTTFDFSPTDSYDLPAVESYVGDFGRVMSRAFGGLWRVTVMWKDSAGMTEDRIRRLVSGLEEKFRTESVFTRTANLEDAFLAIAQMSDDEEGQA